MLNTVRTIATTVFKLGAEVSDEDDEFVDVEGSTEMKLLEKVVQKLAVISSLNAAPEVQTTDDMGEEDIGIINMMRGQDVHAAQQKAAESSKRMSVFAAGPVQVDKNKHRQSSSRFKLEEIGVSHDVYNSLSFNALALTKAQRSQLGMYVIAGFHEPGEGFVSNADEGLVMERFIKAVETEYLPNPYHNFTHAVDVLHGVARMMRLMQSDSFLSELEQFSLLVAAVAHDLGHPGVNNGFLSEVGHDLALQYNDKSPLENMHCAKLYTIVANKATNIFANMSKDQYKEVRKNCIETILHTDMMGHQEMVKHLQIMYQVNSEVFARGARKDDGVGLTVPEVEVFSQPDAKLTIMEMVLHSADVSNPCRSWEVTHAWAMLTLEEFFAQGDQEKSKGIPMQFLNDREKLNRPMSQIGFIEFMLKDFYVAQIRLFPDLCEYGDNCATNIQKWQEMWAAETSPTPSSEEQQKVRDRVDRVCDALDSASQAEPTSP
jgi:cAMP-specific phosphodiesterase 4